MVQIRVIQFLVGNATKYNNYKHELNTCSPKRDCEWPVKVFESSSYPSNFVITRLSV